MKNTKRKRKKSPKNTKNNICYYEYLPPCFSLHRFWNSLIFTVKMNTNFLEKMGNYGPTTPL